MAFLIQFFLLTAAILAVFCANDQFKVTTSSQDYMKIVQAELLFKIKIAEMENTAFDDRMDDRLAVIKLQQLQSLNDTQQVNETLIPLQVLSYPRKYCIQRYAPQLITVDNAKLQFDKCIASAQLQRNNVYTFQTATSAVSSAKKFALYDLLKDGYSCDSSYTNQTLLQDCYYRQMKRDTMLINNYLSTAKENLEASYTDMDYIVDQAVRCSFKVTKDVVMNINSTVSEISACVDELSKKNISSSNYGIETVQNLIATGAIN